MRRTPYESAATLMSHSVICPAEFNVVCCSKPNLPNRTDSNAALLSYLTHQLGSVHEWPFPSLGLQFCILKQGQAFNTFIDDIHLFLIDESTTPPFSNKTPAMHNPASPTLIFKGVRSCIQ